MKTIRFIGISLLALMLCIGSVSCSDDEYATRIHELLIKKEYVFEADEETGDLTTTITFRNEDLSNYKANSDADWCTVTIDPKVSTMTVAVEENNSFEERKATITLLDVKDGVSSRTFTVRQYQNDVIRVDGESTYVVGTDGGQVLINLESNVSYTVHIQNADWITLPSSSGTRGLQKSQVILDVARNTTEKARSAQVLIKDETSGAQTTVLITQEFKAYLTVINTEYTVDELGGDINIYIQTNISFDLYTNPDDSWVKTKGHRETINDNTVCQKISIAPFTAKEPMRTSSVSVQNMSHGEEYTVKITQIRTLYIQESSIKILSGGSGTKLTLYNANNEAVLWKSNDESVAVVDDEGRVTGVSAGSTIITVSSSDGLHTDNVAVTVEKPADLKDKISYQWQEIFTQYDDVSVLTNLKCTITNNSEYDLIVNRATLYCDDVVMSREEYNESTGLCAIGKSKEFKIDIPVEIGKDSVVRDTIYAEDGSIERIDETTIPGKPKENTHLYLLVWEYTYSNESFTYRCYYPKEPDAVVEEPAATRKKFARRAKRR